MRNLKPLLLALLMLFLASAALRASEADLAIPDLHKGRFFNTTADNGISAWNLLFYGSFVIAGTLGISLYLRRQIHNLPAHKSMLDISEIIFQTCKTYLIQQGKFLLMLFVLIAIAISYYLVKAQEGGTTNPDPECGSHIHGGDSRPGAAVRAGRHGWIVLGGLVWHPRQHLCQ